VLEKYLLLHILSECFRKANFLSMPDIRVIKIVFDTTLKANEIPAFRGAIIEAVGREHVVFHNHIGEDQYHYKYPVVQYRSFGKRAGLVCIKEGVDEIHHFFAKNTGEITIGNEKRSLRVDSVRINQFHLQVWDSFFEYSINRWLALNEKNYATYMKLDGIIERIAFLERLLIGNILSMAKGLEWQVDKPIEVKILDIKRQQPTAFKKIKLLSFDVDFKTNVFLPFDIGLGKGASMGYGGIEKIQKRK
jgi:hypothetical protein